MKAMNAFLQNKVFLETNTQVFLSTLQAESRQLDYTAIVFQCTIKQFILLNKASFLLEKNTVGRMQKTSSKDANEVQAWKQDSADFQNL